jgi:hypothetical protein
MTRAQLKGMYTLEMEPFETYLPPALDCFDVCLRAMIGPYGEAGEESFDFKVCTPKWLELECSNEGFVSGRHRLIVSSFDPAQIENVIRKFVASVSGNSWHEVAIRLARFGYWEFEDYEEATFDNAGSNSFGVD